MATTAIGSYLPDVTRRVSQGRVPALDGLRGLAFLAVFFFHYAGGFVYHTGSLPLKVMSSVVALGWSGVDLFFVLSGYLITGILYDTQGDTGYYRKFYARRTLRIFPAYYLTAIVFLLVAPLVGVRWKPAHALFLVYLGYPAALLWPSLVQSTVLRFAHVWSLSIEEQFYLVWAWAITKLRRDRNILICCVVLAALALVLRSAVLFSGWLDASWSNGFILCRMDDLALGGALCMVLRGPMRERIQRAAAPVLMLAAGSFAALCLVRHSIERGDPLVGSVGYTLIALAYGSLLVLTLRPRGLVPSVFSLGILRMFGRYSYGLYLYHFPLTVALIPLRGLLTTRTHSFVLGSLAYLILSLLVNLLIAMASFHFFESPIMRLKSRFEYSNSVSRPVALTKDPSEAASNDEKNCAPVAFEPANG